MILLNILWDYRKSKARSVLLNAFVYTYKCIYSSCFKTETGLHDTVNAKQM